MTKSIVRFGASPVLTLPTGATSPYMLFSSRKLSGWGGNFCQLRGATEIGWKSNNIPNASSFGYVSKWYDQSGNGRDLVQATDAAQPEFDIRNEFRGIRGISFTGDYLANTSKALQSEDTLALNRNAVTFYMVVAPRLSQGAIGWFDFTSLDFSTSRMRLRTTTSSSAKSLQLNGGSNVLAWAPPSQPVIISWSCGASQIMRVGGRELLDATGFSSSVLQSLILGQNVGLSPGIAGDVHFFAAYAAAHSSATMQLMEAELNRCFFPITAPTKRLITTGNSIDMNYLAGANQFHQWVGGFGQATEPDWEIYNIAGIGGAQISGDYTNRAEIATFIDGTKTNVYMCDSATNTLNGSYASQAIAEAAADTIYDTYTAPLVSHMLGAGAARVVVPPAIPRGDFTTGNFIEYARLRYNARVLAAVGGGMVTLSIPASLSNPADATYFNADTVHMTVAGNVAQSGMRKLAIVA